MARVVLALGLIAACTQTPNTSYTEEEALLDRRPLRQSKPIVAIMRDLGIVIPDPAQTTPLLQQVVTELRKADPGGRYEGITYRLTETNSLPRDWLIQTPRWWGRAGADLPAWQLDCPECLAEISLPSCRIDADCGTGQCRLLRVLETSEAGAGRRVCVGHSDYKVERFYRIVADARERVDIASLQPVPDGRYLAALKRALHFLAVSGRPVTVRVLIGQYPPFETDAYALLRDLTRGLDEVRHSRLRVHVAAMRSCLDPTTCGNFSWNHAKIIAVDGRTAIVGGHNLWTRDYLLDRPIHDLSMEVHGPAANDASTFADAMWAFVCEHDGDKKRPIEVRSLLPGSSEVGRVCPPPQGSRPPLPPDRPGNVAVLGIGRMGAGISNDFANHNDLARDLLLGAARQNIKVVQQDFGFTFGAPEAQYPESSMERIADFLLRDQGEVFVVLSNYRARSKSGLHYSNRLYIEQTAQKFREVVKRRTRRPDAEINDLLCRRLYVAPFRFGPENAWPGNIAIGNHAKFWMIDDRAFYIGSDNIYPVDLQEFGYIVDSKVAAADIHREYWDPLWKWSSPHAISGAGVPRCVFTEQPGSRR